MICPHTKWDSHVTVHRCGPDLAVLEVKVRCAECRVPLVGPGDAPWTLAVRIVPPVVQPAPELPRLEAAP